MTSLYFKVPMLHSTDVSRQKACCWKRCDDFFWWQGSFQFSRQWWYANFGNPTISPQKTGITSGGGEHLFKVYGDWPQEPRCLMASGSATARFLQASRLEVPFLENFWRTGSWRLECVCRKLIYKYIRYTLHMHKFARNSCIFFCGAKPLQFWPLIKRYQKRDVYHLEPKRHLITSTFCSALACYKPPIDCSRGPGISFTYKIAQDMSD